MFWAGGTLSRPGALAVACPKLSIYTCLRHLVRSQGLIHCFVLFVRCAKVLYCVGGVNVMSPTGWRYDFTSNSMSLRPGSGHCLSVC